MTSSLDEAFNKAKEQVAQFYQTHGAMQYLPVLKAAVEEMRAEGLDLTLSLRTGREGASPGITLYKDAFFILNGDITLEGSKIDFCVQKTSHSRTYLSFFSGGMGIKESMGMAGEDVKATVRDAVMWMTANADFIKTYEVQPEKPQDVATDSTLKVSSPIRLRKPAVAA